MEVVLFADGTNFLTNVPSVASSVVVGVVVVFVVVVVGAVVVVVVVVVGVVVVVMIFFSVVMSGISNSILFPPGLKPFNMPLDNSD